MKYAVADFGDRLWMICMRPDRTETFQGWFFINEGVLCRGKGLAMYHTFTKVPKARLNNAFSATMELERDRWKRINRENPWKVYGGS